MFTGPYGVSENGTYSEWLAVRNENLCLIPEDIGDVAAAGVPVAYGNKPVAVGAVSMGGGAEHRDADYS